MGFIEKIISKPEKFCTIPLKTILLILRERKNQENHKLEMLTTQVLMENNQNTKYYNLTNGSRFYLIPKKKQLSNKISRAFSNSKKTINVITSWKRHLQAMTNYEKALIEALNNGVKINVFITNKQMQDEIPEKARFLYESPNVSIKYVDTPPKIIAIIVDEQEAFMITQPQSDLVESSALWTDNTSLIAVLTAFFELCWNKPK